MISRIPNYYNKAQDSSGVISPAPCRLRSLSCFNLTVETLYLKLFDSAVGNTTGVPYRIYLVYGAGWTVLDEVLWGENGLYLDDGLTWAASNSLDDETILPDGSCIFETRIN